MNKRNRNTGKTRRHSEFDDGTTQRSPVRSTHPGSTTHEPTKHASRGPHTLAAPHRNLYEKYAGLGREALNESDFVASEYYLQIAEHYLRIMNEKKRHQSSRSTAPINPKSNTEVIKTKESDQETHQLEASEPS